MLYFGIKNKKTGELIRQFFRQNPKNNISVLSFGNVPDSLSVHIFLTRDRNAAVSVLRDGSYENGNEAYKLDTESVVAADDMEIYESEFNL